MTTYHWDHNNRVLWGTDTFRCSSLVISMDSNKLVGKWRSFTKWDAGEYYPRVTSLWIVLNGWPLRERM